MNQTGIVLLNMGGPSSTSEVQPFLKELFSDPDLIRLPARRLLAPLIVALRAPLAKRRYAMIEGGRSPLLSIMMSQAESLERAVKTKYDHQFNVRIGMRYTKPSVEDALRDLLSVGCNKVIFVSMYPQYCSSTTGSSIKAAKKAITALKATFDVKIIDRYFNHPSYLNAVAKSISEAMDNFERPPFVLFSAHGVPVRLVKEGDPYVDETIAGVHGIAGILNLGKDDFDLGFQSRLGPVSWVGPSTDDVLRQIAAAGKDNILFVPISFTADNLETLYDIDIVLTNKATSLGISRVARAKTLNASESFIDALTEMIGKASFK